MPHVIQGNDDPKALGTDWKSADYKYDYPNDLNLKPGSDLHEKIKNRLLERARASSTVMKSRHRSWKKIDEKMTAYIPTDEDEDKIKDKDERRPVSIVFPYSYAMLETYLAYMTAAFIQDPIFMYEGSSPEDTIGAIMLENVIRQHCHRLKVGLPLHTMFRDAGAYGIGIVAPYWERVHGVKIKKRITSSIMGLFKRFERYDSEELLFEGNALDNIDPYDFLPDA